MNFSEPKRKKFKTNKDGNVGQATLYMVSISNMQYTQEYDLTLWTLNISAEYGNLISYGNLIGSQ